MLQLGFPYGVDWKLLLVLIFISCIIVYFYRKFKVSRYSVSDFAQYLTENNLLQLKEQSDSSLVFAELLENVINNRNREKILKSIKLGLIKGDDRLREIIQSELLDKLFMQFKNGTLNIYDYDLDNDFQDLYELWVSKS